MQEDPMLASLLTLRQPRIAAVVLLSVLIIASERSYAAPTSNPAVSTSPSAIRRADSRNEVVVSGEYLAAFTVVVEYIRTQMPRLSKTEKTITNYDVFFYTTPNYYHMEFVPHKLSSEKNLLGCYYKFGRAMDFSVRKTDFMVVGVRPCFG
jgi:hypothetical protein